MSKSLPTFRVHIWGDSRVGKTTLVRKISDTQSFREDDSLGYTIVRKTIGDKPVQLELYDGPASNHPHAIIAVCDESRDETFESLRRQLEDILQTDSIRIFVVANRRDSRSSVGSDRIYQKWCREHVIPSFEVSAQSGDGVNKLMQEVVSHLFREYIRDQMLVCDSITRELYNHPLSRLFREPVDTSLYPDYREVVKTPMDLGTVQEKLRKRRYRSVKEWQDDISLIWSNCDRYNGPNSGFTPILDHLKGLVRKLSKELAPTSMRDIAAEMLSATSRMTKLTDRPPREIASLFPSNTYKESDVRLPFTSRDIEDLSNNIKRLQRDGSVDDQQQLLQIARWFAVDCRNGDVDIAQMSDEAKVYLRWFTRERLARKC